MEHHRKSIGELFEGYTGDYKPKETYWGKDVGKEDVYAVTFAIEIAREKSAFILSEYHRYFMANNITTDDRQNPDVAKYWEMVHLRKELLLCDTIEEVKEIDTVFDNAREHIKKIYEGAVSNMIDRKKQLIEVFEDTQKFYTEDPALKAAVKRSRENARLYEADEYPELSDAPARSGAVRVTKHKTFEAAMALHREYPDKKIAVLNFASASRPGGGVTNGASAQEESLCRCSTLYATLNTKQMWQGYYDVNRSMHDVLHTDACIYSPDIVICKTDESIPKRMKAEDFVTVDVISCAAPNLRNEPANKHNPETGKPMRIEPQKLHDLHLSRAKHILHIAAANGSEIIVLGAFGCGAFQNDPNIVAKAYRDALNEYGNRFDVIEFAIYCRDYETENYDEFKKVLLKGAF